MTKEQGRAPHHHSLTRRRLLGGAGALTAAGWIAGGGGWSLRPRWVNAAAAPVKMGIATDITGAIAAAGNANWQVAQFLADHEAATAGVECRKDEGVIDETPGAYKDIRPRPWWRRHRIGGLCPKRFGCAGTCCWQ